MRAWEQSCPNMDIQLYGGKFSCARFLLSRLGSLTPRNSVFYSRNKAKKLILSPMEKTLDKFKEVCNELLESPGENSVTNFSGYIKQELASGHLVQLSTCFKSITDAVAKLSETDNLTVDQLFDPEVFAVVLDHDVVCTPDATRLLLSLIGFLNAICENATIGKNKLAVLIPVLLRDILLNEERSIPLRIETIKLTNLILGDVVNDGVDLTDQIGMAFRELESKIEHLLVTAGDIELQAGLVEFVIRLIPYDVRQKKAREYFSSNSVSQAFTDILNEEFEVGCRTFLNTLNQNQTENQSVVSFPCHSAFFGTKEVYKPVDDKIKDFWVDFNFGTKTFSMFVEERDKEGNDKESGSWETALIKPDMVEDYRLAGINNDNVALLLKLKGPASDLVTYLSYDHSQYVKISFNDNSSLKSVLVTIFGPERKVQNTYEDSDASSTPSKASVAINPVHIRSTNIEPAYVMPTPSIMLQLSESTTDYEEEKGQLQGRASRNINKEHQKPDGESTENTQRGDLTSDKDEAEHEVGSNLDDKPTIHEDTFEKGSMQGEPVTRSEDERHETESKERSTSTTKPLKRTSQRIQSLTKRQSVQHPLEKPNLTDGKKRKSLPSAFNVSSRLAARKRKSVPTKTLSAAKSRKAIREKVFAKASFSSPRVKSIQEFRNETNTKLHLVTPARRREPRSGKRRIGTFTPLPVKGYKERKADKPKSAFSSSSSNVFSEASDISCYNQGGVSSNRTTDDNEDNGEECADLIQDSLPLADSMEDESGQKQQGLKDSNKGSSVMEKKVTESRQRRQSVSESAAKSRKRTNVSTEKTSERRSTEFKRKTMDKRASLGVKERQQKQRDPSPVDEPIVSSVFPESKRRPTNKRTSQGAKRKHREQRETLSMDESEVSSSEMEDMPENQNDPVLKESQTRRITHKRTSQGAKGKLPEQRETLSMDEPEVSSSEMEDMPKNQNEPVLKAMNESNRRPTNRRLSQGVKGKNQKQRETSRIAELEVVSSSESEDIPENQNEPVLNESNRRTTNKKALQNVREKQQKQRELLPKDASEVGDIEDIHDNKNEPVLEVNDGSDYEVTEWYAGNETECYVEDASPLINSPPIAQASNRTKGQRQMNVDCSTRKSGLDFSESSAKPRVQRPVTKEKKQADNTMRSTPRTRPHKHEFGLHMAKTPQAQQSGEEKSESSEEEEIPFKRVKITPKLTPRELSQQTEVSYATGKEDEKVNTEEESDSVHSDPELDYDFNIDRTPRYKANQNRQDKRQHGLSSGGSNSAKRSMLLNDSGIGETPFGEEKQKRLNFSRKRSWKPLQVSITKTPITPKSDKEEQEEDNSADAETDGEYVSPHMSSEEQTVDKRQRGKRTFADWSTSGPSTSRGPSGTRTSRTEAGWYKEPLHVSEPNVSYRSQHYVKPRKLSYDDKPYDIEDTEEVTNESDEDARREVQSLINIAGTEVLKANRRTCQMIRSYAQRANEVMLSTVDAFWNEHQAASYDAINKYKSQLRDQTQSLEHDLDKTASTVREMEVTFAKHFKILKSQRQVDDKRFKKIQHLQTLMETELTKMEGRRNEQETTLRAEMEKESLKFQKKFLQDTRKQKEDQLKMILNILRIC